jgi:hypothetical protein
MMQHTLDSYTDWKNSFISKSPYQRFVAGPYLKDG